MLGAHLVGPLLEVTKASQAPGLHACIPVCCLGMRRHVLHVSKAVFPSVSGVIMEHLIPQALRALLGHGLRPGLAWPGRRAPGHPPGQVGKQRVGEYLSISFNLP